MQQRACGEKRKEILFRHYVLNVIVMENSE